MGCILIEIRHSESLILQCADAFSALMSVMAIADENCAKRPCDTAWIKFDRGIIVHRAGVFGTRCENLQLLIEERAVFGNRLDRNL